MKKRNVFINCLAIIIMIATIVSCSSAPQYESTGEVIRKTTTTTEKPVIEQKRTSTTTTTESPVIEENRSSTTTTTTKTR